MKMRQKFFHELRRIKSPLKGLIDLTREFMIRYDEKKKNENIMDFDDMEHFALELLIDHYDEEAIQCQVRSQEKSPMDMKKSISMNIKTVTIFRMRS